MMKKTNKRKNFLIRKFNKKVYLLLAALIIGIGTVGGSLAYLQIQASAVTNSFSVGKVETNIVEEFDKTAKKNLSIKNDGTVPVYVRVMLQFNWVKKEGASISVWPTMPEEYKDESNPGDYKIDSLNVNEWVKGDDGYYYYRLPVSPNESTEPLFQTLTYSSNPTIPEGYVLNVDVLSQCVQAYPVEAVQGIWGVNPQTGKPFSQPSGDQGGESV